MIIDKPVGQKTTLMIEKSCNQQGKNPGIYNYIKEKLRKGSPLFISAGISFLSI